MPDKLTVAELATYWGITERGVRARINSERNPLRAEKRGRDYLIDIADALAYKPGPRGPEKRRTRQAEGGAAGTAREGEEE